MDTITINDPFVAAIRREALRLARAGCDLLDEQGPIDWRERVNRETLDMRDPGLCTLGQVYGSYWRGLAALFGEKTYWREGDRLSTAHGFNSHWATPGEPGFDDLTEAWKQVLS